jgi:heme/copper-type cytochrome/quinol oxidase subunit 2
MKKMTLPVALSAFLCVILSGCAASGAANGSSSVLDTVLTVVAIVLLIIGSYFIGQIQRRAYERRKRQTPKPQLKHKSKKKK